MTRAIAVTLLVGFLMTACGTKDVVPGACADAYALGSWVSATDASVWTFREDCTGTDARRNVSFTYALTNKKVSAISFDLVGGTPIDISTGTCSGGTYNANNQYNFGANEPGAPLRMMLQCEPHMGSLIYFTKQ